MGFVISISINC